MLFLQNDEFNIGADWRPSGHGGTYILEMKGDELWYVEMSMGNIEAVKQQIKGNFEEAITRQPLQPPSPTTDRRSEFPPTVLAFHNTAVPAEKQENTSSRPSSIARFRADILGYLILLTIFLIVLFVVLKLRK